jgi:hypothetical protein
MRTVEKRIQDTRKHFNGSAAMTEISVEGYPKYIITNKCEISNYIAEKTGCLCLCCLRVLTEMLLNINFHCTSVYRLFSTTSFVKQKATMTLAKCI